MTAKTICIYSFAVLWSIIVILISIAVKEQIVTTLSVTQTRTLIIMHPDLFKNIIVSPAVYTIWFSVLFDCYLHSFHFQSLDMHPACSYINTHNSLIRGFNIWKIKNRYLSRISPVVYPHSGWSAFVNVWNAGKQVLFDAGNLWFGNMVVSAADEHSITCTCKFLCFLNCGKRMIQCSGMGVRSFRCNIKYSRRNHGKLYLKREQCNGASF